jgi:hypothetical protein
MNARILAAFLLAATSALSTQASAALITYTETADMSGSLDGVGFADNVITLTASGDTSSIVGGPSFFFLHAPLTFALSGGGSGTFADDTIVISNQLVTLAGFGDLTTDQAILDTSNSAFGAYDLSTAIGPVSGGGVFNPGISFATSAGPLIIGSLSGDATFSATIPEPATWAMMLLGFATLSLAGRRRGGQLA